MKLYHKFLILFAFIGITACEEPLEEEVFSSLAPATLFTTENGITSVLNASYAYAHRNGLVQSWAPFYLSSFPTGEVWGAGGSIESLWVQLAEFTWISTHGQLLPVWTVHFNSIRDANIVLDNIENDAFSADFIRVARAEARFIRGWSYGELFYLFGPLPLYQSSSDDPLLGRSTESETIAFIEQELTAAIADLPDDPIAFGRASKSVARGVLCKFYLNTKQWQKAADVAQQIISSNKFALQENYTDVFAVANEGNSEIIWALTKDATSPNASQALNALMFPPDFPRPFPNNGVFAARTYLFDEFVDSFEEGDSRADFFVREYVSTASGETVQGYGRDQTFPYKYEFDPNSVGFFAGNDLPVVRYADILLARAEALNELSGPTQEAIDLINQVRTRANASPISLGDFGSREALRDAILEERGKEFYFEMKRREDMIRHGKFISDAQARGKNAQAHHVLFPIPQVELDANPALTQNPGY